MERLFLEEIIKFTQNIQGHNLSAIYTALCAPRAVEVVDGAHFYIISKKALKEGGGDLYNYNSPRILGLIKMLV